MCERLRARCQVAAGFVLHRFDGGAQGEVHVDAGIAVGDGEDVDGVEGVSVAMEERGGVGEE